VPADRSLDEANKLVTTRLQEILNKPVSLDKGIDRNSPLKDAMEFLADRYDVTILVDEAAFRLEGTEAIGDMPVGLPRLSNVRLQTILQLLCEQVNGRIVCKRTLLSR